MIDSITRLAKELRKGHSHNTIKKHLIKILLAKK